MKAIWAMIPVLFATACVPNGIIKSDQHSAAPAFDPPAAAFPPPSSNASLNTTNTTPRMILPATGGNPVFGIPIGGNMFLPTTGGLPVIGIPLGP